MHAVIERLVCRVLLTGISRMEERKMNCKKQLASTELHTLLVKTRCLRCDELNQRGAPAQNHIFHGKDGWRVCPNFGQGHYLTAAMFLNNRPFTIPLLLHLFWS